MSQILSQDLLSDITIGLLKRASIKLPRSVIEALKNALLQEKNELAKRQIETIIENISIAEAEGIPVCQDTGVPIFYVKISKDCSLSSAFNEGITEGTAKATKLIPLRENVIHPLTKENPGTNTGWGMPYIYYEVIDEDFMEITVLLKGYGSEAKTSLAYIPTTEDVEKGVIKFTLDCVRKALGEPCPPYILGVGLGGSSDIASNLAKKAFLRLPIGKLNSDGEVSTLEKKLLNAVNETGVGPMGLGGETTALAVNVEVCGTHTAAVPVVVAFQCWADRQATARIHSKGEIEYLEL